MYKTIYLGILLLCFGLKINAQDVFKAGITAGITASQYDGDTFNGYNKLGFCGGAYLRSVLTEKWDWQFEINFIQKGAVKQPTDAYPTHYQLLLNYIEVPLLLRYHYKKMVFEGGISEGVLFKNKEYYNDVDVTGLRPMRKFETAFHLGISYPLYSNLDLSWRYSYSILPVRSHESKAVYLLNFGEYNNVLVFTLRYTFNTNTPGE